MKQQHDARRDVAERALQRQADGQAGGAERGEDRGRLDAELLQHRDQGGDDHEIANDAANHQDKSLVDALRALESPARRRGGPAGDNPANDDNGESAQQVHAEPGQHLAVLDPEGLD